MSVISKFQVIDTSCVEFVHPWTGSCSEATAGLFLHSILASLRIYATAYALAMLMKRRVPTRSDIKDSLLGIVQSTAFLSCHAFGYSLALCCIRKVMGNFNFLTVSFVPSFISSVVAILVERPSRRSLLSLYVTNVASETLFRMAVWRRWVTPLPYGEVILFSVSSAILLFLYRCPLKKKDSIYSLLRLFVGPCEESFYTKQVEEKKQPCDTYFERAVDRIKGAGSHPLCPHPHSCLHYALKSGVKLLAIGCSLQVCIKLLLQANNVVKRPTSVLASILQLNTLRIGAFFAGYGGLFRVVSCVLRRVCQVDSPVHAVPAGLVAGLSFMVFRDNTVALYAMWKTIQLLYVIGIEHDLVPPLPGGNVFFHALATAVLFHAAVIEPHNLRPSYWRFLTNISGCRMNLMDRKCLDVFGLESSKSLEMAERRLLRRS